MSLTPQNLAAMCSGSGFNDLKIMDAATENKTVEKMYGKANRAVEFSEPSDVKPSPIVGPSTEPTVFAHITRLILSARS